MPGKHLFLSLSLLATLQIFGFFYLGHKLELLHQNSPTAQITLPVPSAMSSENTQTLVGITELQLQNLLQATILQTRTELDQINQDSPGASVGIDVVPPGSTAPVDEAKNLSAVTHTQELIGQALTNGRWTKADAQIWNEQRDFLSEAQRLSIMEPILEAWERNELELEPAGFPLF